MQHVVTESTFDEYSFWFLTRMKERKQHTPEFPLGTLVPETPEDRLAALKPLKGKCPPWFERARWTIVSMTAADLATVVVVDNEKIRGLGLLRTGTDRTLDNTARIAIKMGYFERPDAADPRHQEYYHKLLEGQLSLSGPNRLVLRELRAGEATLHPEPCPGYFPARTLYLHDGFGRGLPLMILVQRGILPATTPVEAFVARLPNDLAA